MTNKPTLLLKRFLADETNEAENAGRALRRLLGRDAAQIVVVPRDETRVNPLSWVVEDHERQIAALRIENDDLRATITRIAKLAKKHPQASASIYTHKTAR